MDQGSSRPTFRAVKTRPLPSVVKVNSSDPPNGLDGESASIPDIRSRASPPSSSITKTCERVPSFQLSQWRTKISSYSRPLDFSASRSSSRARVQASVGQSGKTSIVKARLVPSGDTIRLPTPNGRSVTCWASPGPIGSRQTWALPERVERKKTEPPSGDQRGLKSAASWVVSRRSPVPSVRTIQRSLRRRFASRSSELTTKTMRLPSGATCGSAMRSMAMRSSTEKGRVC